MSSYISFLVTVLYGDELIKCALKIDMRDYTDELTSYPMEPEHRKILHSLLPLHVQSCGPIVDIENIFEVEDKTKS